MKNERNALNDDVMNKVIGGIKNSPASASGGVRNGTNNTANSIENGVDNAANNVSKGMGLPTPR